MNAVNARTQPEVIDRLIDMYVEWREECAAVWDADARWKSVPPADRALAFASYRAALDREEWAAHVYEDLVERVMPSSPRERERAERANRGPAPLGLSTAT